MKVAIINCFDTYEIRTDVILKFFSDSGFESVVFQSNYQHIKKEYKEVYRKGYIYIKTNSYKKNLSYKRLKSHYKFSKDTMKLVKNYKPDILYVLIPPNYLVKEAVKYKENFKNVKLIFDVIDMWPETMPIKYIDNIFPISMWGALRNNYIDKADFIITECDLYQKILLKYVSADKLKTIYLSKPSEKYESNLILDDTTITFCYLGSINNIVDIDEIVEILKKASKVKHTILKLIGDGERKNDLIKKLQLFGIEVIDYGKIYDTAEKKKIFDTCHYGLNIYKKSTFIGLTLKSIDYFEAGLPIFNNIPGDLTTIVERDGSGVNYSNSADMTNVFASYDFTLREKARYTFIHRLKYEITQEKMFDVMKLLNMENIHNM